MRQLASGQILLQMIYKLNSHNLTNNSDNNNNNNLSTKSKKHKKLKLLECEIINDWNGADQFRSNFKKELREAGLLLSVPNNYFNFTHFQNDDFMEYYDDDDNEDHDDELQKEKGDNLSDSIDLNTQR